MPKENGGDEQKSSNDCFVRGEGHRLRVARKIGDRVGGPDWDKLALMVIGLRLSRIGGIVKSNYTKCRGPQRVLPPQVLRCHYDLIWIQCLRSHLYAVETNLGEMNERFDKFSELPHKSGEIRWSACVRVTATKWFDGGQLDDGIEWKMAFDSISIDLVRGR